MKHVFQEDIKWLIANAENCASYIDWYNHETVEGWTVMEKTEEYRDHIAAMRGSFVADSDDPEAIVMLSDKLEKMTELQEFMIDANRCIRAKDKNKFLLLKFGTEDLWQQLNKPDYYTCLGFRQYEFLMNDVNIRAVRRRLRLLNEDIGRVTNEITVHGVRVIENVETNQIQLIFKATPVMEVREKLSRFFHFRWSEQTGAWERPLSKQGVYETAAFLIWYGDPDAPNTSPPAAVISAATSTEALWPSIADAFAAALAPFLSDSIDHLKNQFHESRIIYDHSFAVACGPIAPSDRTLASA